MTGAGSSVAMGQLVRGWRQHVERFERELPKTLEDHTVWVTHDWVAALHIRDALFRAESELLTKEERDHAEKVIAEIDDIFREISEPDVRGLLSRFLMDMHPRGTREWWWGMIPKRGPVREELNGIIDVHEEAASDGKEIR
ncbi:hypothetical protein [Microbacterium azadirachtae]|uniref:hypothetical protein n=1 Tax=Microbacterium azadirachtae TaxID=582680 RepID=UPI003F74B483